MADCSANANPLAKLNRHTKENKNFNQNGNSGRLFGQQDQAFQNAFQNSFQNGAQQSLGFGEQQNPFPLMRNKPMLQHQSFQHQQSPLSSSQNVNQWKTEFQSQSAPNLQELNQQQAEMTNQLSNHSQSNMSMLSNSNMRSSPMSMMMMQNHNSMHTLAPNYRQGLTSTVSDGSLAGQTSSSTQKQDSHETTAKWEEQFSQLEKQVQETLNIQDLETKETENQTEEVDGIESFEQVKFEQVWEDLQQQKKDMESTIPMSTEDDEYYNSYYKMYTNKPGTAYNFASIENNQYFKNPNAYEMGIILMEQGAKLSEAVLCFEAALQENDKHVDAWLKLGQCNIANELEIQGIAALEKVLELEPTNIEAMMNLSVSYINEGYDLSAYNMLSNWLQTKYKDSLSNYKPITQDSHGHEMSSVEKTLNKFNHILSNSSRSMAIQDKEFQLGMGLLYYTKGDFDQTIDCFQTALESQPEDEIMWNRLGATLANASRSEDAIHAYKRALQLKPTFVRARYNLAVSCINIGCFKEAVEHLLSALSLHEVESSSDNATVFTDANVQLYEKYSSNIMETLKRAFIAMNRRDLLEKIGPTGTKLELSQFRQEFDF